MYLPGFYLEPTTFNPPLSLENTDSLLEQGSGTINEDVLLEQGNILGGFDGATSLDGRRLQKGMTGGRLAATIAAHPLQSTATMKEMTVEPGMRIHEVLADQIRKVRLQMNRRYGVLNGEPETMDFIHHGYEELTGVSDILLFTDGLQLPRENPLAPMNWPMSRASSSWFNRP